MLSCYGFPAEFLDGLTGGKTFVGRSRCSLNRTNFDQGIPTLTKCKKNQQLISMVNFFRQALEDGEAKTFYYAK